MPFNTFVNPDSLVLIGPLATQTDPVSGATGDVSVGGIYSGGQQSGTVTTLATGNTINVGTSGGYGSVRVTAAAAVTGIILQAGTKPGQEFTIIHEGAAANTITFAAAGTSNVADGASDVITGPSARTFIWDSVTALWYRLG